MTSELRVDAIKTTDGTEVMNFDSGGRLVKNNNPYFSVYRSTNQSFSGSNTDIMAYDTVVDNIGGHYSTSTYKFTAPVAGIYFFRWQGMMMNMSTYTFFNMSLHINNGLREEIMIGPNAGQSSSYHTAQGTSIVKLNSSDTADVRIYYNSVAGSPYIRGGVAMNRFEGYLLG